MILSINNNEFSKILCIIGILALPFSWFSSSLGSIYRMLIVVCIITNLILFKGAVPIKKRNQELIAAWLLYFAYTSVRVLFSHDMNAAISNITGLGLFFVMALLYSCQSFSEQDCLKVDYSWLIVGGVSSALFLLGDRSALNLYTSRTTLRIFGTATDPNEFSSLFIIAIPLAVHVLVNTNNVKLKIISAATSVAGFYCVMQGGSRGALLSIAIGVFLVIVFNTKMSLKKAILIALISIIAVYILTHYIFPLIASDIMERLTIRSVMKDGGSGRSLLWGTALKTIWTGPLLNIIFGYGAGGLEITGTTTMHNHFLQVLADTGIIGLILFCLLMYKEYEYFRRYNKTYLPMFFGMMVMSMTLTMGSQVKPFWVFLMIAFLGNVNGEKQL